MKYEKFVESNFPYLNILQRKSEASWNLGDSNFTSKSSETQTTWAVSLNFS